MNQSDKKYIALTFDDGPGSYTTIVLDALEKFHAKATFFSIGENITKETIPILKRADLLGCEIGNHTFHHVNLLDLTKEQVMIEISKTDELLTKALTKKPSLLRPPYGISDANALTYLTHSFVLWSLDTKDWQYLKTDHLIQTVLSSVKDGDIVLMHDAHQSTALGVETILEELSKQGYLFLTVSELAAMKKTSLKDHTIYRSFR